MCVYRSSPNSNSVLTSCGLSLSSAAAPGLYSTILEETTGGFQQSVCFILCTHTDHAHCTLDLPLFAPHSETQLDITAENCVMVCLWVLHLSSKLAGRNDLLSIRDHFSWNERVTYSGVCIFKTTAHFQLNTATRMW